MGFVLDSILKKQLVGSRSNAGTTFETINVSGNSISAEADRSETGFLIAVTYDNGVGANIEFTVEGSSDNISFAPMPDALIVVTDTDGYLVFDINNSNANYVRLAWEVTAGSVDIFCDYSAKRRH